MILVVLVLVLQILKKYDCVYAGIDNIKNSLTHGIDNIFLYEYKKKKQPTTNNVGNITLRI